MRSARSATIVEITLLICGSILAMLIIGKFVEVALLVSLTYLAITIWRRNSFYNWLETGEINGALAGSTLWQDIVRRIELQRQESDQERQSVREQFIDFRQSLGSLSVGLIVTDHQWRLLWWNEMGGQLLELENDGDRGRQLFTLVRSPALQDHIEEENFGKPLVLNHFNNTKKSIEFVIGSMPNSNNVIMVRDITHFERLDDMRTDFIANVSHELKTPLTVINGYIETVLENRLVEGMAEEVLQKAHAQAMEMDNIVQDLLTLSQLETSTSPEFLNFDLKDLVKRVCDQMQLLQKNLAKTNTKIEFDETGEWSMSGSFKEIYSLFVNIIGNAIRYCDDGSTIQISIIDTDSRRIIEIRDNGPGIEQAHIPRLTERFYRVDRSHSSSTGGTGLGLSIAKHIVNRHNGELKIESSFGQGTRVRCVFHSSKNMRD